MNIFQRRESEVRSYCRSFPVVFDRAEGSTLIDEDGRRYIDFFAGAGALNYGHNPEPLRDALVDYVQSGGVTHSLDMHTVAKREFLEAIEEHLLEPRGMDYRVMFPGPTGTNAVEASLKLARKVTGRELIVGFTNGFHGMTLGSLAVTGNATKRAGAGVPLDNTVSMPFDQYSEDVDSLSLLEALLADHSSGLSEPAAFIVETVQAEGGVNVASPEWMRRLARLARNHGALLIVDDIQVGCGRTGGFFSFEEMEIEPDIICLSKSLSGYGLPLAINLIRPEIDVWEPGEHNGTFRGHNPAFVTATAALRRYWADEKLASQVLRNGQFTDRALKEIAANHPEDIVETRGRGMIRGLVFAHPEDASAVSAEAFERGLVIETAGPRGEVLKTLPALTISDDELSEGLEIVARATTTVLERRDASEAPRPEVVQ